MVTAFDVAGPQQHVYTAGMSHGLGDIGQADHGKQLSIACLSSAPSYDSDA